MHLHRWTCAAFAVCVMALTGCDTKPEDIAKWKAEKNTGKLVKTLGDERQFMRLEAIKALAEIGAADAVNALGALLKDPDVVIVHAALDALAAIGTPAIEPYMTQAVTFDTDPARLTAARALGELKSADSADALITALNDPYEAVAVEAAVSLGKIGAPRAIPALADSSQKGSVRLRGASVTSIRQIGSEATMQPLLAVLGDESPKVRNEASAGLIEIGPAVAPHVIQTLRSANDFERRSALAVLDALRQVPAAGSDLVWYMLADLAVDPQPDIQKSEVQKLAQIDGCEPALIDALSHSDAGIREYALQALEKIGEPVAAQVLAAAGSVQPEAAKWLSGRSSWAGAPAWSLDLWAAATALNPEFRQNNREAGLLNNTGTATESLLKSGDFRPDREIIPLLIGQMASSETRNAETRRTLAFRKLRAYKERAKLPLLAAVNDEDLELAARAARILVDIDDDPRASQAVLSSFGRRIEAGENLYDTPFYNAMIELDMPEAHELLLQVRPNPRGAMYTFRKKYPGVQVSNMSLPEGQQHPTAEPFRLKYLKDGKAREMRVIFRPDDRGNWMPEPPLPDELP